MWTRENPGRVDPVNPTVVGAEKQTGGRILCEDSLSRVGSSFSFGSCHKSLSANWEAWAVTTNKRPPYRQYHQTAASCGAREGSNTSATFEGFVRISTTEIQGSTTNTWTRVQHDCKIRGSQLQRLLGAKGGDEMHYTAVGGRKFPISGYYWWAGAWDHSTEEP